MIKKLTVNNMTIPVPVPLATLGEVLDWYRDCMLADGKAITSVMLNGIDVTESLFNSSAVAVNERSDLLLHVESPRELAIQCLEGTTRLASAIRNTLQERAVEIYQFQGNVSPVSLVHLEQDLEILIELISHLSELVDATGVSFAGVAATHRLIIRATNSIKDSHLRKDWRECSESILLRLAFYLKDLAKESELLHFDLLSSGNKDDGFITAAVK